MNTCRICLEPAELEGQEGTGSGKIIFPEARCIIYATCNPVMCPHTKAEEPGKVHFKFQDSGQGHYPKTIPYNYPVV